MKKEEFLQQVRTRLDVLLESEREKELRILSDSINTDDDIKGLGSVDDVCKKIYTSRGIDYAKIHGDGRVHQGLEDMFLIIQNLVQQMSKNSFKDNVKIVFDLLILFAFIAIIKIPFIAVRNLGDSLFSYLDLTFVSNIWGLVIELVYIVVAFILFINIFNRYFSNYKKEVTKKKDMVKGKALESITLEDKKNGE